MKARTKVLASFEAGMNSPNLPWHVNITSLKHRSRFGEVPCFCQVEEFNSQMQAFFWRFCFASPKFRESCVERYKEFSGLKGQLSRVAHARVSDGKLENIRLMFSSLSRQIQNEVEQWQTWREKNQFGTEEEVRGSSRI